MIVIARNFGQLGNRLLLSAHLIAAAREHGVTLVNPSFAEYARYFPATADDLLCRYPRREQVNESDSQPSDLLRQVTYKSIYLSGKGLWYAQQIGCPVNLIRLKGDKTCDLAGEDFKRRAQSPVPLLVSGWQFRSADLLQKHAAAVREHFKILPEHQRRVDQLITRIQGQAEYVVGVHIRHGDYATFENGKYFYSVEQYVAAMRRISEQLGNDRVAFLVCGNGKLDRSDFGELAVHFGTGHLIEDMYAFADTDLLIGPPSTYTKWASFYGGVPLQFMQTADQEFDLSMFPKELPAKQAA